MVVDRRLVRQFRRGPEREQAGHTVYAKCISDLIDTEQLERVGVLCGAPMRRVRNKSSKVLHGKLFNQVDCFVFDFGCLVVWGCTRPQLARVVEHLLSFCTHAFPYPTEDKVIYCLNHSGNVILTNHPSPLTEPNETDMSCIIGDTIFISSDSMYEKLAYSYALAQGVQLDIYERDLALRIEELGDLPQDLKETGDCSLTTSETAKKLGEIFLLQYEVNLHSDVVESPPDTFWDLDSVAPIYAIARAFLDLEHRVDVLNKRLSFMRDMYSMLQSETQVKDTKKLDWIIIFGVIGEVLVAALQMGLIFYQSYWEKRGISRSIDHAA